MSEHIRKTVADLAEDVRLKESEVSSLKKLINQLCDKAGMDHLYSGAEAESASKSSVLRSDQFYGQPLATAVRAILEMRKAAGKGAATVNEIHAALKEGGFNFNTKDDDNAKRNLRISLTKNATTFHRLPQGEWGMLEWYPNAKQPKDDTDGTSSVMLVDHEIKPKKTDLVLKALPQDGSPIDLKTLSQRVGSDPRLVSATCSNLQRKGRVESGGRGLWKLARIDCK